MSAHGVLGPYLQDVWQPLYPDLDISLSEWGAPLCIVVRAAEGYPSHVSFVRLDDIPSTARPGDLVGYLDAKAREAVDEYRQPWNHVRVLGELMASAGDAMAYLMS